MQTFFTFLLIGVTASAVYAISATGLVVTYITSGVFNFAHGAIGMFLAFVYWELHVNQGWPTLLALFVTLGVIAPLIGVLLDVAVMRRLLVGASVATKLVVTLAVLLVFQGLALAGWGIKLRALPGLWGDRHTVKLFSLVITWDQITTVLAAVAVAFGLRVLFRRTRLGVAMRAVVDSKELCAIKGISPNRVTAASWALGSMLAGLAAILIAPGLNLEVNTLSLLVVSAYAAAVLGRLESLPATFAGALLLGVGEKLIIGYLPQSNELVRNLEPAFPFILLLGALLLRPQRRLPEKVPVHTEPDPPRFRTTAILGVVGIAACIAIAPLLKDHDVLTGSKALVFSCLTLSLVLLTGLSGQVSIMQLSFAGFGAVFVGKVATGLPYPVSLGMAALATAALGVIVALPVMRLRGIYLALSTLAFAILMDALFFQSSHILNLGTTIPVRRPSIVGTGERGMFILLAVATAVFANVFLAVRRSSFGRQMSALRDSPMASQTMGMSLSWAKLKIFGLSAGMAGLAGGLLGSLQVWVGPLDFIYFRSLTLLLVAAIFGITSVSGALLGALFFVVLPDVLRNVASTGQGAGVTSQALQPLIIGVLAMALARHSEGIAGQIRNRLRPLWQRALPFTRDADDDLNGDGHVTGPLQLVPEAAPQKAPVGA
ncbi:MAG: ABC transporter permease [Actinobacteria bacterium]|nr:ABC transporter permease [Actinomycetota bacterium]